jgi:tRNA U38,U39,U40 pseudouridine synthase TruA
MVGILQKIGMNEQSLDDLKKILSGKGEHKNNFMAPPYGLYLFNVKDYVFDC